eukprot:2571327-Heterocapsa_arctica.AAC.1
MQCHAGSAVQPRVAAGSGELRKRSVRHGPAPPVELRARELQPATQPPRERGRQLALAQDALDRLDVL